MDVSQNTLDPVQSGDDCLVGCQPPCGNVAPRGTVLDYHVVAPWVEVTFQNGNGFKLTVGNSSFPHPDPGLRHTAVIKDFEFGVSDGAGCRFTVHDQIGSPFVTFVDRLNKQFNETTNDYQMQVRFGWIARDCSGKPISTDDMKSRKITFLPTSVECSFNDGGKIVYTIEGKDMFQIIAQGRTPVTYGTDDHKIGLKEAIRQMFQQDPKPLLNVKFLRQTKNGTEEWEFQDNPQACWPGSTKSKLEAALDWLKPYVTDKGRGIYYTWDTGEDIPTVIFWEAPFGAQGVIDPICLKHYIVNGGKCSPVISFSPKANMVFTKIMNKTGGGAGIGGAKAQKGGGQEGKEDQIGAGLQMHTVSQVRNSVLDTHGLSSATTEKVMKAEIENSRTFFPFGHSVTAELVIQGDPSDIFTITTEWSGKYVSIVVINPFHLSVNHGPLNEGIEGQDPDGTNALCPVWLAVPACNPVFTSNSWYVLKINHSIRLGSYLTTISVKLDHPGADITEEQLDPFDRSNPLLVRQE